MSLQLRIATVGAWDDMSLLLEIVSLLIEFVHLRVDGVRSGVRHFESDIASFRATSIENRLDNEWRGLQDQCERDKEQ